MPNLIAEIAVTAPLKKTFSYLVPEELTASARVGMRVRVPFGRRRTVGFVIDLRDGESEGLKKIHELLDAEPLFSADLLKFFRWAADYYGHPLGQTIKTALPGGLSGEQQRVNILTEPVYRALSMDDHPRGNKQKQLYDQIQEQTDKDADGDASLFAQILVATTDFDIYIISYFLKIMFGFHSWD